MASNTVTTTRRAVLSAALALPAAAAITIIPHAAQGAVAASGEWDRALAAYRQVKRLHTMLWDRWEQADEAVGEATPDRIDRYFDDYRLGIGMRRADVEYQLRTYNTGRSEGRIDVTRTADEFDAYQRQIIETRERFQTDRLYKEASAHNPAYNAARDALMEVPAPTAAALLVKIEIAARSLDDDHAGSMLADARRLLSQGLQA